MLRAALISALASQPQVAQAKTVWLLRFWSETYPCGQVWQLKRGFTGITSTGLVGQEALSSSLYRNRDQDWNDKARLSPRFWATCLPGFSLVPVASQTMFLTRKSATAIRCSHGKSGSGLFYPVPTPVRLTSGKLGDLELCLSPAIRALLLPGGLALQPEHFLGFAGADELMHTKVCAIGSRNAKGYAHIRPNQGPSTARFNGWCG